MNSAINLQPSEKSENLTFEWGRLTWFASRPLGNSEDMTVGRCVLKPGKNNPRHYHPNCSEILVVMEGRIRHTTTEGTETVMNPDDTVTIPPNTWHSATNIGNAEAVLFIAFSSPDRMTVGE